MSLNKPGLYRKYKIEKASGEPIDPHADYFVLRIDTDQWARKALEKYADDIEIFNRSLAAQLRARLNQSVSIQKPLEEPQL